MRIGNTCIALFILAIATGLFFLLRCFPIGAAAAIQPGVAHPGVHPSAGRVQAPSPAESAPTARRAAGDERPRNQLLVRILDGTPNGVRRSLQGAAVRLLDATGAELALATSDGRGYVHFQDLAAGTAGLCVELDGFAPARRELELSVPPGRSQQVEVTYLMRLGDELRGRVLGPDGEPLAGALVALDPGREWTHGGRLRQRGSRYDQLQPSLPHARSDELGRFRLRTLHGVPAAALRVCPARPDLPPVVRFVLEEGTGGPHDLSIPPGTEVVLRAADESGASAPGRLRVDSGTVVFDLLEDPVLGPLVSAADLCAVRRTASEVRLRLPPGGYTVRLYPEQGKPSAQFLPVHDDLPIERDILAAAAPH